MGYPGLLRQYWTMTYRLRFRIFIPGYFPSLITFDRVGCPFLSPSTLDPLLVSDPSDQFDLRYRFTHEP